MNHKKKQASYRAMKRRASTLEVELVVARFEVFDALQEQNRLNGRVHRAETALWAKQRVKLPPDFLEHIVRRMGDEIARDLARRVREKNPGKYDLVAGKACEIVADIAFGHRNFYAADRSLDDMLQFYVSEVMETGEFQFDLQLEGTIHRRVDRHVPMMVSDRKTTTQTQMDKIPVRMVYPLTGNGEGRYETVDRMGDLRGRYEVAA